MRVQIIIRTEKGQKIFDYEVQRRYTGKGWWNCSLSFMYNPKEDKMMDIALWHTNKKWWQFWK